MYLKERSSIIKRTLYEKQLYSSFPFLFLSQSLLTKTNAQDDCCGLGSIMSLVLYSGIHGGYGFQQFSAEGFNHYIDVYNENRTATLTKKMD